jgi:hypothetical protein
MFYLGPGQSNKKKDNPVLAKWIVCLLWKGVVAQVGNQGL